MAIDGELQGQQAQGQDHLHDLRQILENLSAAHATGIILRDVKPENIIFDPIKGKFKLIDLGAAADLRFGFNYQPKEFILDPRFSGPEEYIMSTQTPEPPPTPVALALSPALWQLNLPDRFDSYSAGVTLLQMCLPTLRSDNNLIAFRKKLEENGESLSQWRQELPPRWFSGADGEGFDVLDLDDRAGWELCKSLMFKTREKRSSATGARFSRFIQGQEPGGGHPRQPRRLHAGGERPGGRRTARVAGVPRGAVGDKQEGGFTEAQLSNFREEGTVEKEEDASRYLGMVATETLAKYGVNKMDRKMDDEPAGASADEDDETEAPTASAKPQFKNPFAGFQMPKIGGDD